MTRKRSKLKLLVSFNGTFGFRPSSRKFRYTGGETRIISVDRNITYSKLKSRIADLVRPHGGVSEFSLKYRVFVSFSSGGGDGDEETTKMTTPMLILLESDDDVRCMVEEYEMAELQCKFLTRLWVFVCSDRINNENSTCTIGFVDEHVLNVAGDGFFVGKKGILGDDLMTLLGRSDNNSNNKSGKKISDDYSLRKMVLRQQLLSKKLDEFSSSSSSSFGDVAEQSEMELTSENGDFEGPLRESCSEPESPSSFQSKTMNFGGHLCRKATDYKYLNALRMARQNFGKVLPVTESNSSPLNPNDGNLRLGSDGPKRGFSEQSHMILGNGNSSSLDSSCLYVAIGQPQKLSPSSGVSSIMNGLGANCDSRSDYRATWSEMNRENIMPLHGNGHMIRNEVFRLSGHNQLTGSVFPLRAPPGCERGQEGYQDGIRNHRFGFSEAKNQRIGPYHIRSRSLGLEMGSNHNFKWEGRPWVGKFYPRLRSSSNISKPGPVFRSYRDVSLKPFSGSCYHQVEERYGTMDHGLNNHNKIFRLPYCGQENLIKAGFHGVLKHERTNHGEGNAVYGGACVGASDEFPLPIDATERAVDNRIDLLTSPNTEKLDIACQALSANAVDDVGMTGENPFGSSRGVHLSDQEEVINCGSPHNLGCSSGTVVSCDNKFCYTESGCGSNIYQSSDHTLDGHKACAVDLSLHNLSLASSRKLQLPAPPCATVDNSQCLLKLPSKDLDLMDEVHLNSGPKVEKSSDIVSNSSSDKRGKDDDEKQKMDFEEQDENKKTNTCLKVNGGNPTDIATFYTHLATRELQNIKNSDLECIKELGSGTCGTVYYGKWKGSDVAIKRIKASCFTDGAKEEDRLVADFWKEAHILGQLHHPNIVALYGIVTDGPANTLAIVTEYMVNGSLKQVLRKKDRTIDRRKRLIIAMDAAFGMEYLHEKNIVHFDLKSHNFLMNTRDPQRPICKIGDLGLSKIKQRTLVSGGIRGTIPWMAPELLNGKNLVSEKVDVYSFAIVMWELLTGEEPFADMRSEEIIAGILRGNLRPEIPSWCDPAWRSLMERCWSSDPDSRPSFSEIAKELRAMAAAMNIK